MAVKSSPSFADDVADFFGEYWLHILVIILAYIVWKNHWQIGTLALFGTIFIGWVAWRLWVHYIQQDFISGIEFVVLEIVPPREVLRSPQAMELFFTNALYHWSIKGGKESYWQGAVWFWFSLEIASIEGQVHFYIRTPSRVRTLIETQMYAQYPQAQVKLVEDYTLAIPEITPTSEWNGWGCEFKLAKPEAYPIKTYVDYGLDKDPKEEFKVDPIAPVIEFFGSLQKGEQAWMQIVVTPSKKTWKSNGSLFARHGWVEESLIQIEKLKKPFTKKSRQPDGSIYIEGRTPAYLEGIIEGMSEKVHKLGFETGIRVMYLAKKELFPTGTRNNNSRNIRLVMRQYAKPESNEFERINSTQGDAYGGIMTLSSETVLMLANRKLRAFRERDFFHESLREKLLSKHYLFWPLTLMVHAHFHLETFVLNVEELATLWHFPGQILKVPTLERIESKEASPPPNLPQ